MSWQLYTSENQLSYTDRVIFQENLALDSLGCYQNMTKKLIATVVFSIHMLLFTDIFVTWILKFENFFRQ